MPNEYPRLLYRERETRRVESAEDEAAATADGFGRDVPRSWWANQTLVVDKPEPDPLPVVPDAPRKGWRKKGRA